MTLTMRDIYRIVVKADLPIRICGGHTVVTMPDGGRPLLLRTLGRPDANVHRVVSKTIKRLRKCGLIHDGRLP
jgi:hypothetical protein